MNIQGIRSNILLPLLTLSIVFLSACGSGSSSDETTNSVGPFSIGGTILGNSDTVTLSLNGSHETFSGSAFTFETTLNSNQSFIVSVISSPSGQTCKVLNGSGTSAGDITSISVRCIDDSVNTTDYLCTDHKATQNNVIGNNTYEFIAENGECFGTQQDYGITKQEVTASLDLDGNAVSLVTISSSVKLTSEIMNSIPPAGGYNLHIAFDITNISSNKVCIDFTGASLRNASNDVLADIQIDVLGDMYYGETSLRPRFHNDCIPAGEKRTVWGNRVIGHESILNSSDTLTVEEFATLDHIVVIVDDLDIPDARNDDYFLEALAPTEADWSIEHNVDINNVDFYGYTIVNTFQNMTNKAVAFDFYLEDIIYFDENGYIIYSSLSSIADYLNKDKNELTDADYRLDANGGEIGLQDQYSGIIPSLGATTIVGRASKVVMSLAICDDQDTNNSCDVR